MREHPLQRLYAGSCDIGGPECGSAWTRGCESGAASDQGAVAEIGSRADRAAAAAYAGCASLPRRGGALQRAQELPEQEIPVIEGGSIGAAIYQVWTAMMDGAPVLPSITLTFRTAPTLRLAKSLPI